MTVTKGERTYTVRENTASWLVTLPGEKLTVEYSVSKNLCADFESLKKYIQDEKLF